jgi:hypothetical protein
MHKLVRFISIRIQVIYEVKDHCNETGNTKGHLLFVNAMFIFMSDCWFTSSEQYFPAIS